VIPGIFPFHIFKYLNGHIPGHVQGIVHAGESGMVNAGWQLRMRRHAERLISSHRRLPVQKVEKELAALGFVELGADQVAVAFEHRTMELYLEVELDEGKIHSYFIVPFEEKEKKRRKYRW